MCIIKYLIIMLITVLFTITGFAHENEEYKHKNIPMCHGWKRGPAVGIRICPIDKDHKMCVNFIFSHGRWHISEPYKCDRDE